MRAAGYTSILPDRLVISHHLLKMHKKSFNGGMWHITRSGLRGERSCPSLSDGVRANFATVGLWVSGSNNKAIALVA